MKVPDGRIWEFVYDGSIRTQVSRNGRRVNANRDYSVEIVSPILTYRKDIDTLQELVRRIRKAGAFTNSSCGIHIHLDGSPHTPRSIRNFVNIIASRNDLFYKALEIKNERMRYCKRMDDILVEKMNRKKPKTMREIEDIWYEGYSESRSRHYHNSRYHFLNLHSFLEETERLSYEALTVSFTQGK